MRKIIVNGNTSEVRTLSPFAYKDTIKSLDKNNEGGTRVTIDGTPVAKSCVTSGRDVKSGNGGMKYQLYFYPTAEAAAARDTSRREFLPITSSEFTAYKNDPAFVFAITSVTVPPTMVEQPTEAQTALASAVGVEPELIAAAAALTPEQVEQLKTQAATPTTRKAKRK